MVALEPGILRPENYALTTRDCLGVGPQLIFRHCPAHLGERCSERRDDLFDGLALVSVEDGIELRLRLGSDVADGFIWPPSRSPA